MFANEDAKKKVLVKILRSDGETLVGNLLLPLVSDLLRSMNNDVKYFEFEDLSGSVRMIAKSSIVELQSEEILKKAELKGHSAYNADPYELLGVSFDASWSDVRKAYVELTKKYHPDTYSNVSLPKEVVAYMSGVFSQSNTAYNLIKSTRKRSEAA